ncbi:MAG: M56 family metallopeptidase [Geodermatophilaceae bacterium]
MNLAACLLLYSMVVTVLGPPLLARVTNSGAAPRAGMAAWAAAMASVVLSWVVAAIVLVVDLVRAWGQVDRLFAACFTTLRATAIGGYGQFLQAILAMLTASAVLALGVLATRVATGVRRANVHTQRHAEAALLAARGASRGPGGTIVVDAAEPSVYCLASRPPTIVITTGALGALDEEQLAAVLVHEDAHLAGRHHQLLALARALAKILPGIRLFTEAAAEFARLAEMRADDTAAQRHGPDTVVAALLALTVRTPVPAPALGASGLGVADRVERLLFPPASARTRLGAILGSLLIAPMITAVLVITQSPLCITPLS